MFDYKNPEFQKKLNNGVKVVQKTEIILSINFST